MTVVERLITTQFCDDVRQEAGNKYSLMGCYSQELIVESFPAVLPKFCAHVLAFTPIDRPFADIVFRSYLNDQLVGQSVIAPETLAEAAQHVAAFRKPEQTRLLLSYVMMFAPFVIPAKGELRVDAESEGEVLRGPTLTLREVGAIAKDTTL
jgi:hypothetical protein